jgi:intein/homing endonuclease
VLSTSHSEGWGLCLDPETNVYTNNGIKFLKDVSISDKIYTSQSFNKIKNIQTRDYSGKLYNIQTWKGTLIKASDNHPFYVNNIGFKRADELSVGDELVFPRLKTSKKEKFDIAKYLFGFSLIFFIR